MVLGSSDRSGLERVFPGPTATRLLSGSPVAVAVAPVGYADQQPDSGAVGCGYDGSAAAREALNWAADFARRGVVRSACSPFSASSPSVMSE